MRLALFLPKKSLFLCARQLNSTSIYYILLPTAEFMACLLYCRRQHEVTSLLGLKKRLHFDELGG